MITILTATNLKESIHEVILTVNRLDELVVIVSNPEEIDPTSKLLTVEDDVVRTSLDWNDTEPPYIFPEIAFNANNLLAIIFYKLGNQQKALEFVSEDNSLYNDLLVATHLQFGYDISDPMFSKISTLVNQCIVQHYGQYTNRFTIETLKKMSKS